MTGTTNQIQTPFGTGVRTALGLAAGAAGGISNIPANPSVVVGGSPYGTMFSIWQGYTFSNGSYSGPYVIGNYNNVAPNGVGDILPAVTSLDFGSIQILNNMLTANASTWPVLTSVVANNLLQIGSDFTASAPVVSTLTMPLLQYVGGALSPSLSVLTNFSLASLISVNGAIGVGAGAATTISMPSLVYVGATFGLSAALCTTLTLTNLSYVGGAMSPTLTALTTMSLPAITVINGAFSVGTPTALTTFSFGSGLLNINGNVTITGAALNQASVDGILVSLAALNGSGGTTAWSSRTVNLSGGTSSAPSATGLAAKATLQARSCTVTTN